VNSKVRAKHDQRPPVLALRARDDLNLAEPILYLSEVEDFSDSGQKMGQKGTKNAILAFREKNHVL